MLFGKIRGGRLEFFVSCGTRILRVLASLSLVCRKSHNAKTLDAAAAESLDYFELPRNPLSTARVATVWVDAI
jgi:hypothetical protein